MSEPVSNDCEPGPRAAVPLGLVADGPGGGQTPPAIAAGAFVHETAILDPGCQIGPGAKVWHFCHVRSGAVLGRDVSLARDVYVDQDVPIGDSSRVQNGVSIYRGVTVGRCCFIGPHTIFTNDIVPRVGMRSWQIVPTTIEDGASLGAGVIVRCGVRIGSFALVGTGSVVTRDVPAFQLVHGLPARPRRRICACGKTQSPLSWPLRGVLGCCHEHLIPEVLSVALAEEQRAVRAAEDQSRDRGVDRTCQGSGSGW